MYTCMCMYRERKGDTRNSGREPKVHHSDGVSESTNKTQEKVMCFIESKKIVDIFDWDVDVSWRIWFLDLINHGNDHTAQERPALIMLIRRNAVEISHIVRIEKRDPTCSWRRLTLSRPVTLQLLWKYTQSKVSNKCTHATRLGISARLTAMTLTEIGSVNTVAKTLVISSMMSSRILTPRGASIVVHAGRAQTLAKFF